MDKKRNQDYQRKMAEKAQRDQLNEDKNMAEYYETQNRIMTAHMEYWELTKKYEKFMEKTWNPFIKAKMESRAAQSKAEAEALAKKAQVTTAPKTEA
jgi:hypothetical protein